MNSHYARHHGARRPAANRNGQISPRLRVVVLVLLTGLVLGPGHLRGAPDETRSAASPQQTVFIRAGIIETISHGTLVNAALIMRAGKIEAVGTNLAPPPGARVLNFPSGVVTPGLIETAAGTGLSEIELENSTVDIHAASSNDPVRAAFHTADAFNPRSPVIPVARAGGVTSIVAMPTGGFVSGVSLWADLSGVPFHPETHARIRRRDAALNVVLGRESARSLGGSRGMAFLRLRELFEDAELYSREKDRFRTNRLRPLGASPSDLRTLSKVRADRLPLVMLANRADDILRAVRLAEELGLQAVILGGAEAHVVARDLARTKTPVILNSLDDAPSDFDHLRATPRNAAILHKAGVPVVLSTLDALDFRHRAHVLRLIAGNAARFGMPRAAALRSITLEAAHTFGMSETHGSLQKGRAANVVVWSGDPLEIKTHVVAVFVEGRKMSSDSRQRRLLRKYRTLPQQ